MRRLILTGVLIFFMIFAFICYFKGMTFPFRVYNFAEIQEEKAITDTKMGTLAIKKSTECGTIRTRLTKSESDFQSAKMLYESAISNRSEEEQEKAIASKSYDLSYLWIKLGNYATETKCDLTMEVFQDPNNTTGNEENYVLCNFKFNVVASYSGIVNFIDKIATDGDLGIIPENLKLFTEYRDVKVLSSENERGYDDARELVLVTEFYKTDIPITKTTLSKVENELTIKAEEEAKAAEEAEAAKSSK